MTVMEALQWGTQRLKSSQVRLDSPMLDAEVLLAHTLGVSKSWLFTHFERTLEEPRLDGFRAYIGRRAAGEPVAYITGEKAFYGRRFDVDRHTLIPRPETERLVEAALDAYGEGDPQRTLIADIGTGSGAVAVTLAAETGAPVIGTDIDGSAVEIARKNARRHEAADRTDIRTGDLAEPLLDIFAAIKENGARPYRDLIVCANLPYLTPAQWRDAPESVRGFEPETALVAGDDGLDAYRRLLRQLKGDRDVLPFRVAVILEIDPSQTELIRELIISAFPRAHVRVQKDLAGRDRVVIAEI